MKISLIVLLMLSFGSISAQQFKVGETAPEIIMNGVDGEEIKLSSLRGQVVLIDFWASWCKPCRKENPKIVNAYNEYKDKNFEGGKGFTVFSVSLDTKEAAWKKAIASDELEWEYHVSDLKGWNNEVAKLYKIRSIPQSYLIDGDGKIIKVNPRGNALERELKRISKKSWFNW